MLKREKITSAVSSLITEEVDVDKYLLEDYEKLKTKCDEIISKIKVRKVKKTKKGETLLATEDKGKI
jgi:hypothetical protein